MNVRYDFIRWRVNLFLHTENNIYLCLDMISDNEPIISKFISVPKDLASLNCGAFLAGIVEAILDGSQFVCDY